MQAERTNRALLLLAAAAVSLCSIGCQVPGGSFGHEPLQTRFAALTQRVIEAEEQHPTADPYVPADVEPIVLAGTSAEANGL